MSLPEEPFAIGIDIGATKIASVLLRATGEVVCSTQVPTRPGEGAGAVLGRVADQVLELARQSPGAVAGVGIGSPGQVDAAHGVVRNAVNLGWDTVRLAEEVTSRTGRILPVRVQKDANLSALGEQYFGAGRDCADFVYLGIGSGLGAGVISGGRLVTGGDWYAADVGHLSVDPEGAPCACGGRGCAETIASGPGLVRVMAEMLAGGTDLEPAAILAAAAEGDPLAQRALGEVGRVLGIVMAACTAVLNPSRYVIGGGLGLAGFEFILPAARRELERRTIPESRRLLEIRPSQVESPAVGAACLAWYARHTEAAAS